MSCRDLTWSNIVLSWESRLEVPRRLHSKQFAKNVVQSALGGKRRIKSARLNLRALKSMFFFEVGL